MISTFFAFFSIPLPTRSDSWILLSMRLDWERHVSESRSISCVIGGWWRCWIKQNLHPGKERKPQKISDMHKKENMKGANTRSTADRSYPIYGYIRSCNIIYMYSSSSSSPLFRRRRRLFLPKGCCDHGGGNDPTVTIHKVRDVPIPFPLILIIE